MSERWPPELDARLTELWTARELSCVAIAARLGGGLTKNAVIGRVNRLGLSGLGGSVPGRQTSEQAREAMRAARAARPRYVNPIDHRALAALYQPARPISQQEPIVTEAAFVGPHRVVTFADLREFDCRWIPGPTDGANTLCCGAAQVSDSPYCARHRKISNVPRRPPSERRAGDAIPRTITRSLKSGSYL